MAAPMNATLITNNIENVLTGMAVSSLGRFDFGSNNIRVEISTTSSDSHVIGIISSIPSIDDTSASLVSDESSTLSHYPITFIPIRGPVLRGESSVTEVWVIYDPEATTYQPMSRIYNGSLLTTSPIPGFMMAQNTVDDETDAREYNNVYYNHTIGRAVTDCFPSTSSRDILAKGELKVQPDYLELKTSRGVTDDYTIRNIYGYFKNNPYVGKALKVALIRVIV